MKVAQKCVICAGQIDSKEVTTRDLRSLMFLRCEDCGFGRFTHDPLPNLEKSMLDDTRLSSVGIDAGTADIKLANAREQGMHYVQSLLSDLPKGERILDFGCGVGGFVNEALEAGFDAYGVEIDPQLRDLMKKRVTKNCFASLTEIENLRFKRIFLFYVLEHIPNFTAFLADIRSLLEDDGELILVTPNLNDALSSALGSTGFSEFMYEYHSVNYFTKSSLQRSFEAGPWGDVDVWSKQGYSLFNHVNWMLNRKPTKNRGVGEDTVFNDIFRPAFQNAQQDDNFGNVSASIERLFEDFDKTYKAFVESEGLGNQLWLKAKKC